MNRRHTKIWLGIGASVLALPGAADAAPPQAAPLASAAALAQPALHGGLPAHIWLAAGGEGGEGGEAGSSAQGGEAGIDVQEADRNPVAWGLALSVIEAHFHAGLKAYSAGETEAGAQMFAHGLGEVFVEMQPVFERRDITGLGEMLGATVEMALAKAPPTALEAQVDKVLAALAAAAKKGPAGAEEPAVRARVVADLLDRAAAQYTLAMGGTDQESYLDGLGFALAAQRRGADVLGWLEQKDAAGATALRQALALSARAYPGAKRPASPAVDAGLLLGAVSKAKFALADL